MDALDEIVDPLLGEETWSAAIPGIGADVDHSDSIVGVEHVDGVVRPYRDPPLQRAGVPGEQRVEGQRWKREVVDEVDAACDVDLDEVVAVDLDEDPHRALVTRGGQPGR